MAGQGRRGRTVESWNGLTQGNRRRWIRAYGSEDAALEAYRNGATLTPAQRGHAHTPERPINALFAPVEYPRYVATHTEELNEIARQRGLAQHGTGERGDEATSYEGSGGDFTWVVPEGTLNARSGWRFSKVFRTEPEAQLYARRSWAPAGVVIIQDRAWVKGQDRPYASEIVWRYEVWFGYPEGVKRRNKRGKRTYIPPTPPDQIERIRRGYDGLA